MKQNYQLLLDRTIRELEERQEVPTLFLHSCCAPCSSYVLEYLSQYFAITVFYYNPNIYPDEEYRQRVEEQKRLIEVIPAKHPIGFVEGDFDKERFFQVTHGLEDLPEGDERCRRCYRLRLEEAAKMAKELGMDYMTTTLSISPRKNAEWLNEIGREMEMLYGVSYLYSDFKKRNGYQRSVELSAAYGLYRQDYCGCIYSYQERKRQSQEMKQ